MKTRNDEAWILMIYGIEPIYGAPCLSWIHGRELFLKTKPKIQQPEQMCDARARLESYRSVLSFGSSACIQRLCTVSGTCTCTINWNKVNLLHFDNTLCYTGMKKEDSWQIGKGVTIIHQQNCSLRAIIKFRYQFGYTINWVEDTDWKNNMGAGAFFNEKDNT